jgi:hypothetical protein
MTLTRSMSHPAVASADVVSTFTDTRGDPTARHRRHQIFAGIQTPVVVRYLAIPALSTTSPLSTRNASDAAVSQIGVDQPRVSPEHCDQPRTCLHITTRIPTAKVAHLPCAVSRARQ